MQLTLISVYYYVCERYNSTLCWEVQRFSPNGNCGIITDEEIITIYLFCVAFQEKNKIKSMHKYILDHWLSWFPNLPSYETFVSRLNRISCIFPSLVSCLHDDLDKIETKIPIVLTDSMPIITCSHKRKAKVALEMTDKGYCSTKNLHYFGVKLHSWEQIKPLLTVKKSFIQSFLSIQYFIKSIIFLKQLPIPKFRQNIQVFIGFFGCFSATSGAF